MPHRGVEIASLVGHLGHAHVRDTGSWQRRAARDRRDLQCPAVRLEFRVQVALGAVDLAEAMALRGDQEGQAGRVPPVDDRRQHALGIGQPAATASPPRPGAPRTSDAIIDWPSPNSTSAREANAIVASMSPRSSASERPVVGDPPGDVREAAGGSVDRRRFRLLPDIRVGALGGIQQPIDRLHLSTLEGQDHLRQQQPRTRLG